MIYILDTADIEEIRYCNEFYPVSGVTTNPTIISKEHDDFWKIVKEIRAIIGPDKIKEMTNTIVIGLQTGIDLEKIKSISLFLLIIYLFLLY